MLHHAPCQAMAQRMGAPVIQAGALIGVTDNLCTPSTLMGTSWGASARTNTAGFVVDGRSCRT